MKEWFRRWIKILRDKRGSQTIEYVAVMAGAALLAMILNSVMESNEIQDALREKIECVITQECNETDVASNKKTDDESSGYIPDGVINPVNDNLPESDPSLNPLGFNDYDWDYSWEQTNDTSKSDQKPPEDEGFFGKLKREAGEAWDGFKEKANDVWEGTKEVASDTWDGIKSGAEAAWDWTVEHKEEIGAGLTVAAGVGLLFVPGGQALGAGILIGAAVGGGMAAYNGADSKEIAQAAMFGGLTGAVGGGVGNVVGRGLMAGLSRAASSNFIRTRFPALASGISAGGSESLADDFFHGRKLNWKNAGIAALTAGGMLVGGSFGTQLMNATTPTGPIAGIKAANQSGVTGEAAKKTVKKVEEVEYGKHFTRENRKKVLKPNVKYTASEGYTYKTDSLGRINSAKGELTLEKAKRNPYAQRVAGREDRASDDHGGHLIASIFGGSGDLDNLVPMNQNLNQGRWKQMENDWANAIKEGKKVQVDIKPRYKGKSRRPDQFDVRYKIDDNEWVRSVLKNAPGG